MSRSRSSHGFRIVTLASIRKPWDERHELGTRDRRQRTPGPARQPDPVCSVEVPEHAPDGRVAELLTHVAGREILTECCRNFEETAVGPAVIVVEPTGHFDAHRALPTPARRRRRLPERSAPPGP